MAQHGGLVSSDGHHFACRHTLQPVHTIFLIDCSGSMGRHDVRPNRALWRALHPNRLGCVLAAVESFVERRRGSGPDDQVSLIAFNKVASRGPTGVRLANFDQTASAWLRERVAWGGTCFKSAISALGTCVREVGTSPVRHLAIMLSDGEGAFPEQGLQELLEAEGGRNPMRIHTVQFPHEPSSKQGHVLRRIAQAAIDQSGGDAFSLCSSFAESLDGIALQEAFVGIADSLCKPAGGLMTM